MSLLRLIGSCVLALTSVGCGSNGIFGGGHELAYAAAAGSCGPTDGPAVAIYLSPTPVGSLEPSAPYVRINVLQPLDRLTDRTWVLGGDEPDGGAVYYSGAGEYEVAEGGWIGVSSVASDSTLTGFALLRFPTSGLIRREFHAAWIPRTMLCG
jgi:hypothetical protein